MAHLNADEKRSHKSSKLNSPKKSKTEANVNISRVLPNKSPRHIKRILNRVTIQNGTITDNKKSNSTIVKLSNIVKEHSAVIKKRHIAKKHSTNTIGTRSS